MEHYPDARFWGYVVLAGFNHDGKLDFPASGNLIALRALEHRHRRHQQRRLAGPRAHNAQLFRRQSIRTAEQP